MQTYTAVQAAADLVAYMKQCGTRYYSEWYVGITCDIEDRLFGDHNVNRNTDAWIWRRTGGDSMAREAESSFHASGCKGSHGGGGSDCVFIYAYRISQTTKE